MARKSRGPAASATRLSSRPFVVLIASFPAVNQCQSCRASQPAPLMPHGRRSEDRMTRVPRPPRVHTVARAPRPIYDAPRRTRRLTLSRHRRSSLSSPLFHRLQFTPMAERFPGDGAAANGFGRRHLHEDEVRLLYEANYPAHQTCGCRAPRGSASAASRCRTRPPEVLGALKLRAFSSRRRSRHGIS